MKCKKCKAEVTEEALEFSQDHDYWYGGSHNDCGCMKESEVDGMECNCKF